MVVTGLAADLCNLQGITTESNTGLAAELVPLMETMVSAPDQVMLAIGPLRSFTRSLDRMMAAGSDLVETAERAGYDRIEIANVIRAWNRQLGGVYGDFVKARSCMYTAAKAARIPTKRFAKRKPSRNLRGLELPALATDADRIARRLVPGIKKTGDQAAFLLKNLDRLQKKWVKKPPATDSDAFREDAGAVINEFLTLRDMVGGSIFAAMNGIVRRLDAMSLLGGVDKFGKPPRPLRVPSPAEVAALQPKARETVKNVRQEPAKAVPMHDPRYPEGWTPGRMSSRRHPTFEWNGDEYLLTPVMLKSMLSQMPKEMRAAHARWASPEGQKAARAAWSKMEGVMGVAEVDSLFEEIVSMEHNRAAGEYALNNGMTMRPTYRSKHFLEEMGLEEAGLKHQPHEEDQITEANVGTIYQKGKDTYVDTAFLNNVGGVLPGWHVKHMGFGEFSLEGPEGKVIEFDRMRGRNFPGQSGRSHLLYPGRGADKKIVSKLMAKMVKTGKAKMVKAVKIPSPKEMAKKTGMKLRAKTRGKTQAALYDYFMDLFHYRGGQRPWIELNTLAREMPGLKGIHHKKLVQALEAMVRSGLLDKQGGGTGQGDMYRLAESVEQTHDLTEGMEGSPIGQHEVKVGMVVGATSIWNDKKGKAPAWKILKIGNGFVDVGLASKSGAWGRGHKAARYKWADGAYRKGGKKAPSMLVYPDPDYYMEESDLTEAKIKAKVTNVKLNHPDGARYLVKVEGYGMVEVIVGRTGLISTKVSPKAKAGTAYAAARAVKNFRKEHQAAQSGTQKGGAYFEDVDLEEAAFSAFTKKIAKEGKWVKLSGGLIQFRWNGMTYGEIQDRRAQGSRSLDRYEVEDLDDELFEKLVDAKKAVIVKVAAPAIKKDWPGGYVAEDVDLEEAVRPGQYFVVVDVSVPGGKMASKKIFHGARKADELAAKLMKKGRNVQVIDAMWFQPARNMLKASGMVGESMAVGPETRFKPGRYRFRSLGVKTPEGKMVASGYIEIDDVGDVEDFDFDIKQGKTKQEYEKLPVKVQNTILMTARREVTKRAAMR